MSEEVEKFAGWLRSRGAIPTVVALRQRFEAIRRAELQRLEFKLSSLPPEARARVDEVTRLIVEKLLLTPTEQLKSLGDSGHGRPLRRGRDAHLQSADGGAGGGLARTNRNGPLADASSRSPSQGARSALSLVTTTRELRLGTRGSQLALWQARTVAARIADSRRTALPSGDRQDVRRSPARGAALRNRAASGSSSRKSKTQLLRRRNRPRRAQQQRHVGGRCVDGLEIAAVLPREDPLDAVVLPASADRSRARRRRAWSESSARRRPSATGSVRRVAQLRRAVSRCALRANPG